MKNFLRGSKKWGYKAKKVGGVNTQNTPGFGTPVCSNISLITHAPAFKESVISITCAHIIP